MGKQGPCRHCGVTTTPLWRNGPPDKPVLCNACGSRWRTKGSLANYFPLHIRELPGSEGTNVPKFKSISFKSNEQKLHNKKKCNVVGEIKREMPFCGQNFSKVLEDMSNRSSSGSAISYSESCAHFGTTDANELTASSQSNAWDTLVPSKKRTHLARPKHSPVEKLRKELYTILHEQQSSYLSGTSEEDLIYESDTPMGSIEIGHGGVLIRPPNSKNLEEESEASSFPGDSKPPSSSLVHCESKTTKNTNVGSEKVKKSTARVASDHVKRDKSSHDRLHDLQGRDSPLTSVDLKDVVSFEVFMRLLSHEEQQQLMKYLPPVDTAKFAKSLRSLFYSPQFVETLSYFQQLLLEGVFEVPSLQGKTVEYRTLKRLVLFNLTKFRWVEHYKQLKDVNLKKDMGEKEIVTVLNVQRQQDMIPLKRPLDSQNQMFPELKGTMRSPKRASKSGIINLSSKSCQPNASDACSKSMYGTEDFLDDEEASFSPRSLFAFPPERNSMLASLQFTDDSSDQNLLIDVPSNGPFPQAELFFSPLRQKGVPSSSQAESGVFQKEEESASNHSFVQQQPGLG